ncbi:MAG: carbohydrate kinase [Saccharospirillaceae bacterium]|nr:carbohydrate kinase [Pseudomonadales bacterium]NRB78766.1 carbohydrate kinase [Saccharospirillaceae bacterium]
MILCFGEILIDFLNFNQIQVDKTALNEFRQYPGGAPANVAVAVAKLGGQTRFLGQVGDDQFGRFLIEAMQQYNVDTQYLYVHPHAATALAFVFLDEHKERRFEFYRKNTADIVFSEEQLVDEVFAGATIFHFCSNTLTDESIFNVSIKAIKKAKARGCLISFDVNLRFNLWLDNKVDINRIKQALILADVIKVSKQEAQWIINNGFEIKAWLNTAQIIWQTDGANNIEIFTKDKHFIVPTKKVQVVDSTAAGDAFSAGLLMALNQFDCLFNNKYTLSEDDIKKITVFASSCGAVAVTKLGAFPSLPTMDDVQQDWGF